MAGAVGALLAMTGILFIPVFAVLTIATLYASVAQSPLARAAIGAASAAAAGLIIGTAIRLLRVRDCRRADSPSAPSVFAAVALVQAPLLWVLAVAVPAAIALEWFRSRSP